MDYLTLAYSRTQHAADLVATTTEVIGIDCDHVKWNRQRRRRPSDGNRCRMLVSDLRQDHDQVDVAVWVLFAAR